jgi:hypothetical protein
LIARFQPADNVELNLINEMAIASWRARRASALETELLSTEVEELADLTGLETDSNGVVLSAFGYANAVGRNKAVVELARQAERLNRLWMRLHTKLKELQKDRKAAEKQAVASAGQGAAGKRKNEPEERNRRRISELARSAGGRPDPWNRRRRRKSRSRDSPWLPDRRRVRFPGGQPPADGSKLMTGTAKIVAKHPAPPTRSRLVCPANQARSYSHAAAFAPFRHFSIVGQAR